MGCLATMEAWNGRFTVAAIFVMICTVLDFLDGYAARMLKAYSDIGKQLDSLADLVSFGVAPAAIAAGLLIEGAEACGWVLSGSAFYFLCIIPLLIPIFSAVRLARFNVEQHTETHFRGMPVPADAAAFASLALIQGNSRFPAVEGFLLHPIFIVVLILLNSWLMVAPMSMFSFKLKNYRPKANPWRYLFAAVAFGLVIVLRGIGLFSTFILYVLASLGMNLRLRYRKNEEIET
jgi:CDP-diacylglycerol--serine O-phosphatidyltransferase